MTTLQRAVAFGAGMVGMPIPNAAQKTKQKEKRIGEKKRAPHRAETPSLMTGGENRRIV